MVYSITHSPPLVAHDVRAMTAYRDKSHNHLGLILDRRLDFNLQKKIGKANTDICMLRKLYKDLPQNTLLNIYKSFIRPRSDQCDIRYHRPVMAI